MLVILTLRGRAADDVLEEGVLWGHEPPAAARHASPHRASPAPPRLTCLHLRHDRSTPLLRHTLHNTRAGRYCTRLLEAHSGLRDICLIYLA